MPEDELHERQFIIEAFKQTVARKNTMRIPIGPAYSSSRLDKWKVISELIPPNTLLLDIGFYNCTFARHLRSYMQTHGIRYVTVNVDKEAIEDAKRKKANIVVASYSFLPFKNEAFDACSLLQVFDLLSIPDVAIKEAHRILKPNGKLILTVHNFADFTNRLSLLMGKNIVPGAERSSLIRFFTWKSLNDFLRRNEFELEERRAWYLPFPIKRMEKNSLWRKIMKLPARLFPNQSEGLIGRWRKTDKRGNKR